MNNRLEFQFGLIGWPLEHSFSPVLHAAALSVCGFKGEYRLFGVPPVPEGQESLEEILDQVRCGKLHGVNVTIPHKQNVLACLDKTSLTAREIGAVNTIYLENGQLIGDNTDAQGFLQDIRTKLPQQPKQKLALVLGAGGSSRAITYALSRDGWQVIVAARRLNQAQTLASDLSGSQQFDIAACLLSAEGLKELSPTLIVNTTPVGMSPNTNASPWPSDIPLPQHCFVYDLVYNPTETVLVQNARSSGLLAAGGIGMLVEQAALSFERWTGHPASRTAMVEAVSKHLIIHTNKQEENYAA